jgi:hypothetical protein
VLILLARDRKADQAVRAASLHVLCQLLFMHEGTTQLAALADAGAIDAAVGCLADADLRCSRGSDTSHMGRMAMAFLAAAGNFLFDIEKSAQTRTSQALLTAVPFAVSVLINRRQLQASAVDEYTVAAAVRMITNLAYVGPMQEKLTQLNPSPVDALGDVVSEGKAAYACTAAAIALANLVGQEESSIMSSELVSENVVEYLVGALRAALEDAQWQGTYYAPWKVAQALSKLAISDAQKRRITAGGAVPTLVRGLAYKGSNIGRTARAQELCTSALFSLAVSANSKELIKAEALEQLQRVAADGLTEDARKMAQSAVFELTNQGASIATTAGDVLASDGHVMLSYCWNEQAAVLAVRSALRAHGYNVWIDVEQMKGSTVDAMAQAIEGASVVLMCVSKGYKESANCRLEANYALQRGIDVVPLMMQPNYKADGWLGMALGTKLWYEITADAGSAKFSTSINGLVRELGTRGMQVAGQGNSGGVSNDRIPGDAPKNHGTVSSSSIATAAKDVLQTSTCSPAATTMSYATDSGQERQGTLSTTVARAVGNTVVHKAQRASIPVSAQVSSSTPEAPLEWQRSWEAILKAKSQLDELIDEANDVASRVESLGRLMRKNDCSDGAEGHVQSLQAAAEPARVFAQQLVAQRENAGRILSKLASDMTKVVVHTMVRTATGRERDEWTPPCRSSHARLSHNTIIPYFPPTQKVKNKAVSNGVCANEVFGFN